MPKLVVIADDLTGALDTGIKFAKEGISTAVVIVQPDSPLHQEENVEVLVVCAPTRHLPSHQAYDMVYQLTASFAAQSIPYLYKKTDSVLRGNIGSELEAVYRGSGCGQIPFMPALPALGRTTQAGIQYLNGTPIHQTIFHSDPLNPVTKSDVVEIVTAQTALSCRSVSSDQLGLPDSPQIPVVDASTNQQLDEIADKLEALGQLSVTAGCAGFAAALEKKIPFSTQQITVPDLHGPALLACGTINPVTQAQVAYACAHGYHYFDLTAIQRCTQLEELHRQAKALAVTLFDLCAQGKSAAFSTRVVTEEDIALGSAPSQELQLLRVEEIIAIILEHLLQLGIDVPLFVVGGDTLTALLRRISCNCIRPSCEMAEGVVLSYINYGEKQHPLLSKSGGFGSDDTCINLFGAGQ